MSVAEMVRDLVDESVESMELAAHNGFHPAKFFKQCGFDALDQAFAFLDH